MRNKKKNTKQERQKGGISLIVLVLTIIIMIILAAAVIITLNNTHIINNAQGAVNSTNLKQVQQLASVAWLTAISDGITDQVGLQMAVNDYLTGCGIDPDDYYIIVTPTKVEVRKDPYTYTIIDNLTNVTASSSNKETIKENESVTLTYEAGEGYTLPETVTVTGATSTWNKAAGTLTLTNATSNVTITIGGATLSALPEGWNADAVVAVVDTVPIPKGFVASPYSDENTKADGLVIYELATGETEIPSTETQHTSWTTRNQYVWVPVDNFETEFVRTYYGSGESNLSNTLGVEDNPSLDEDDEDDEDVYTPNYWEVALDLTTNLPLPTQDTTYMSATTLAEVQAMYASVKKYGGFYVARYEMGLDSERTSNSSVSGITAHSKMNKIPFSYLSWSSSSTMSADTGGAVEVARRLYPTSNANYGVVSTLVYDVQWDTTINWIANTKLADGTTAKYPNILTDSTDYGNYDGHVITSADELNEGASYSRLDESGPRLVGYTQVTPESTKGIYSSWALTTGALKAAKTNNIYDMAGNMCEWNMGGFGISYRLFRGGAFFDPGNYRTIANREPSWPTEDLYGVAGDLSARVALYVK